MADDAAPPARPDGAPARPDGAPARPDGAPARRDLRASHEDRDRIVEVLQTSAGDGRLSLEELDERVEAALTARTYGELEALVLDLPAAPGAAAAVPPGQAEGTCRASSAAAVR